MGGKAGHRFVLISEWESLIPGFFFIVDRSEPPIDSLDLAPEHQTLTPELHLNLGYTRLSG